MLASAGYRKRLCNLKARVRFGEPGREKGGADQILRTKLAEPLAVHCVKTQSPESKGD